MPENKIHTRLHHIKDFWNRTLWDLDLNPLSPIKRRGVIILRIFAIILKSFKSDKCPVHAAALTNITLMSLVPALAFVFALAKGFYPPDKLSSDFRSSVSDLPQDIQDVLVTLLTKVQETDFSTMGTISFVLITWTVLSLLGKIEATFNGIWGIKNNRKLIVKVKEYFFTLLIVPTILAITTSINTALKNPDLIDYLKDLFGTFYLLYNVILVLLTPLTVTAAFTYLYMFLPNTKVKFMPAVGAGFITALLWISLQWLYVTFQIGVASNNAIYGTFASIPLFLAWLSSCWMLILLGAEISFAIQNYNTYEDESLAINYSNSTKLNLAVCLTRDAADYFFDGR
ncbi:MAG: YihY/virulence factor BrkB family protein, partial [Lentisphaeraceae bacterium]|nr:YihY/virulence factor BrkB family protein [Lentisphaeraceae bacterium]